MEVISQGINFDLKKSPLFNLSLSSKELFHSNFLAWLCEIYPEDMGRIFNEYITHKPSDLTINENNVEREKKNKDLTFQYNDGVDENGTDTTKATKVIVELKIKSLPDEKQLEKYYDPECQNHLLMSMVKPYFLSETWSFVDYSKFINKLSNIKTHNNYHSELIKDYVEFTSSLCKIIKRSEVVSDKPFLLSTKKKKPLEELRIHDVIYKMRSSQLADKLYKALREKNYSGCNVCRTNWWSHTGEGDICIWHGYSNMSGLIQAGILFNKNQKGNSQAPFSVVGIQFQNNQFRLISEISNNEISLQVAEELKDKELWFNFNISELTKSRVEHEYPKKMEAFNKFKNFKYRYRTIDINTKTEQIINGIIEYIDDLVLKKDQIKEVITKNIKTL